MGKVDPGKPVEAEEESQQRVRGGLGGEPSRRKGAERKAHGMGEQAMAANLGKRAECQAGLGIGTQETGAS
jgi:hypothetical protein